MLFILGLDLLPGHRCPFVACNCLQRDYVASSQRCDGSVDCRRASFPDADIVRNLGSNARSGVKMHQPQIALHLRIVHDSQKWRLFQLNRQALAKRAVKNGIACGIREIGDQDGVLFAQACRLAMAQEKDTSERQQQNHAAGGEQEFSPSRLPQARNRARRLVRLFLFNHNLRSCPCLRHEGLAVLRNRANRRRKLVASSRQSHDVLAVLRRVSERLAQQEDVLAQVRFLNERVRPDLLEEFFL